MKRLVSIILAISTIMVGLTSCDFYKHNSVIRSGKPELYAVACFSVPFITGSPWDSLEVLEEDNYGRIIFMYKSSTDLLSDYCSNDGFLYSLVVCQKYDNDYSYYYENYNFIYLKNEDLIYDHELNVLKEKNDWNKPLDESRMSKVVNNDFMPYKNSHVSNKDALSSISKYLSVETTDVEYLCDEICIDNYDRCFYAVREYSHDRGQYTFYNTYFAICNKKNEVLIENGNPCILKVEDIVHCQNDMQTIKEHSNWNMPM